MSNPRKDPLREAARRRTCPTCQAPPGFTCVTRNDRPTDLHHARLFGAIPVRRRA